MSSSKVEKIVRINADLETVLEVICDFSKYHEFLPEIKKAEIVSEETGFKLVRFHVDMIKTFTYDLAMKQSKDRLDWHFIRGDVFKENKGAWILSKKSDTVTEAKYELEASFGVFVPKMIVTKMVSQNLPKMMEAFEKRAISLYEKKLSK